MSITYSFHVDWDATDWKATPDFSEAIDDITDYVETFYIDRGKNQEQGNNPAGTLDITLDNSDKRFSPPYAAGPLFGKMRPWLPIRVQTTIAAATETVYTGFISKIKVNPDMNTQQAFLYCTDGADLLARNMVTQDGTNRTEMSDGTAVDRILDAAGWPVAKRDIDTDGGNVKYPLTVEF